jgi:hypothetical protein
MITVWDFSFKITEEYQSDATTVDCFGTPSAIIWWCQGVRYSINIINPMQLD